MRKSIDIYPINGKLKVIQSGKRILLTKEEEKYIDKEVKKRKEGFNSIIPHLEKVEFEKKETKITLGIMNYDITYGLLQAIRKGRKFPSVKNGFVPNISIEPLFVTKDRFIPFTRRKLNALHIPGKWETPGSGYMTSWNFKSKKICGDKKWESDKRLYDPKFHLKSRTKKTFPNADFKIKSFFGFIIDKLECFEPSFGCIVELKKTHKELNKKGITWIHTSKLGEMLERQGDIKNINLKTFVPKNNEDIRLHGLALGQIIAGYKELTGKEIDNLIIKKIRKEVDIKIIKGKKMLKF